MCEWLSREEWSDVSLLCGGRAFAAHRAVLASVSTFLRGILLSCPTEETPTLIVLPDFDQEALSAVLFYIYNGEVTISKQKLGKFLDIVKAMQIFIDRQYLIETSINDTNYYANKSIDDDRKFVLRSENDSNTPLVTLRKLFQHKFPRDTKFKDTLDYKECMQSQNSNEQFKPVLGNLQSAHGHRQRDYFLRDSFMELYPRNRNANGGAGVTAIPNGSYRSPTSLFLNNANVNRCIPDMVNMPSDNAASHMPYNLITSYLLKSYQETTALTELNRKAVSNVGLTSTGPSEEPLRSCEALMSYLDLSRLQKSHTAMPPFATNKVLIDELPWLSKGDTTTQLRAEKFSNITETSQNKVAILNKALESPWSPRYPDSFRPFRRKESKTSNPNDDNNNIPVKTVLMNSSSDLGNSSQLVPTTSTLEIGKGPVKSQVSTTEAQSRRYTCTECSKTFSQLRNFRYHMSVHRGTREFAASCAVCEKSFNDRGYLSSHMKIHRNRKEYKCAQCPKSFNQRVAYNMHVRIHTGIKPHVCPTCGKAFSRKMLLKQHQRTHSGERPYACPHCEKRFADRSNMTLHLRLHTGVKPFKCPMCPKSFTKKHHLKSHVNFHTGAKPYSCPRCLLAFTQSSNMRTHLKRCTAPEPAGGTAKDSA